MIKIESNQSSYINLEETFYISNKINEDIFIPFYESLKLISEKTNYLFIASPLIVLGDALLTLVQTVSFAVESFFKGLANVAIGICTLKIRRIGLGIIQALALGLLVGISSPFYTLYKIAKISYRMRESFNGTLIDQIQKKQLSKRICVNFDQWLSFKFPDTDCEWQFEDDLEEEYPLNKSSKTTSDVMKEFEEAGGYISPKTRATMENN